MTFGRKALVGGLLAATVLISPAMAVAKPVSVEERLDKLEAEVGTLRSDLDTARSENANLKVRAEQADARAQTAEAKAAAAEQRVAVLETKTAAPAPAAPPPADGFRAGTTTIRLGGFIKLTASSTRFSDGEVATNSLGRDFYLPQTIPTSGGPASRTTDFNAKQSRFWLNFGTDIAQHTVKGYLEVDFQTGPGTQGSQRTTNGYNLALRRAYVQLDRWTFGQDWTTFQYTGALPETTDFVGGSEGTVFVRQAQIRYSAPVGKGLTFNLALENPEAGTAISGSPTLIENGDDSLPDLAARLVYTGKGGEFSLAGLARQVRVANAGVTADTGGYGVSLGGKLFFNSAKTGDFRFQVTYGRNIGRYVGLNFAPDAVFVPASNSLESVDVFAAIGAVRVPIGPGLRVNLMGSYQNVDYSSALSAANIATFNKEGWSVAANLFYSPVKNIDLGFELRHGERKLVNGDEGSTDRADFTVKFSF